jgi:lysyl endopeptidase
VEFFSPGTSDPHALPLAARAVSHLLTGPASHFEKRLTEIGDAGSCNVDVPCSSLETSAAFQDATNAVAQMVINDGQFIALCTGTLLNDTDTSTQIPWFFSANHCFDNEQAPFKTPAQMQTVANTLDTLWFFRSSSCNAKQVSPNYRDLPGGATYIYSDLVSDILFLRLNAAPPQGAFFSGWNANAITSGSPVVALHHPEGDLLKVSQGTVLGFTTPDSPPVSSGTNKFISIHWGSGTTEPGSSGAGIFTNTGTQYVLRGALWGGEASCDTPGSPDVFSRFDLAAPVLAQYLVPGGTPSTDYTDLWWNPNESGWGLSVVQHPTRQIFAVWYVYGSDGKATWFVLPSGSWTSSNTYTGTLYSVTGPAFSGSFDPRLVQNSQVGTGTLSFGDANNGTWSYSVGGVSGSKAISRQPF